MRLEGKVALVTGGARGQGEAEARLFVEHGASVVIGDVLDDAGGAVAADLGDRAAFVHLDVGDETLWDRAIKTVLDRFGKLDVLVNNAGILHVSSLAETTLADYERVIRVNQIGTFLGMRSAIAPMKEAGGGSIVNVSSTDGLTGENGLLAYAATKWAIRGMTKTAALELGHAGIRVNSLHPGPVDTAMIAPAEPGIDPNIYFTDQPIPRIADPIEIARVVLFLASDESSYCTGAEFIADGGATAGTIVERNPLS